MGIAVVIAAGSPPAAELVGQLPVGVRMVAVDGGLGVCRTLDIAPDDVVGDFDSCDPDDLRWAERAGATIHRFPPDKDATDLELALDLVDDAVDRVIVLGADGGRIDHQLGNWAVVSDPRRKPRIEIWTAGGRVSVVHEHIDLTGERGDLVSLVPWGGPTTGVTTTGLRWPLENRDLSAFSSRGISNEFVDEVASVSIDGGVLFLVRPDRV